MPMLHTFAYNSMSVIKSMIQDNSSTVIYCAIYIGMIKVSYEWPKKSFNHLATHA